MGGGITLYHFLVLSLIIFGLGMYCVLSRRNAIGILMGVELILNSANINYLAFDFYGGAKAVGGAATYHYDGQIFAIFVIMLAAAEAVIGLAVVLAIYQNFKTIDVSATETMSG
jgi:NADH-quinone oxidoreductase subunit K